MSQQELLKQVVQVLAEAGIDYMATGSVASSLQGEPRATHDIDLVVVIPPAAIGTLVAAFPPPNYFLTEASIRDAIQRQSMFNLISLTEGDKVDFWMLTSESFDQSRFARKKVTEALGFPLKVSSPEDTILAKLRWAHLSGGSEKQFTDALRIYEVQRATLDHGYLEHWAALLGILALWEQVKATAEPL
jgi:hypothetical protein